MKTTTKNSGIKVNAGVKAAGYYSNHSSAGLKVRTSIKAGSTTALRPNHTSTRLLGLRQSLTAKTTKSNGIKVNTGVKAAGFYSNHSGAGIKVRTSVKAGSTTALRPNHTSRLLGLR